MAGLPLYNARTRSLEKAYSSYTRRHLTSRKIWLEPVEEDPKEMGVRNWRRTANSWTENSG